MVSNPWSPQLQSISYLLVDLYLFLYIICTIRKSIVNLIETEAEFKIGTIKGN